MSAIVCPRCSFPWSKGEITSNGLCTGCRAETDSAWAKRQEERFEREMRRTVDARCWVVRCVCSTCEETGARDYYVDDDCLPIGRPREAREFRNLAEAREVAKAQPSHGVFRRGWRRGFVTRAYVVKHNGSPFRDDPEMWLGGRTKGGGMWWGHTPGQAREFKREATARKWALGEFGDADHRVLRRGRRTK